MIDPAQVQVTAVPTPSCIRPRRAAGEQVPVAVPPTLRNDRAAAPRRSTARELLETALTGIRLGCRDSQFLSRLVHWDKRNAAAVASLLERARQAGREEGGLTPRQREVVIAALSDAAIYRASGAAEARCWDCEIIPGGGRCGDHAKDNDRARAYAELAAVLSGTSQAELLQPRDIVGYRLHAPVAS
jgi:hypothetical protein